MALEFYNAFRNAFDGEPANYWQELRQAAVDDTWFDTSTVRKVQGQTMPGMRTYACESVQVNSVLDPKTGTSLGDNYRKIIYRVLKDNEIKDDLTKTKRWLGKYYKLEGYTWLTINTNTNIGALATAVLEKCNNSLKWYDKDKILHVWPCVFERTLGSTSFSWGSQEVPEVDSTTLIKVQLNEETAKIPFNQRFLFDGHAFQVKQLNNHISKTYLEIYMFETQIQANDDLENNIANLPDNVVPFTAESKILPEVNNLLKGDTQTFTVYNYVDGKPNADTFSVVCSGPKENVNYILTIIDGNTFTIENLAQSYEPLVITCTNNSNPDDVVSVELLLGGLW